MHFDGYDKHRINMEGANPRCVPVYSDSYLQLGVEFESVFFELLMRKYDKVALKDIPSETVDSQNVKSDG